MRVAVALIGLLVLCCFGDLGSLAEVERTLYPSEWEALKVIASKLEISSDVWDFNANPCILPAAGAWVNVPPSTNLVTNTVVSNLTCGDCDNTSNLCHVLSIQLKSMNLTGMLPVEVANLTHLAYLDLTRNELTGAIPAAWGSLPLINLTLLGNRISGVIPDDIGNISTLRYLNVEDNSLDGGIPASLGRLTNLTRLLLSASDLVGEIPEELGNLKSLTDFRIDGTGISGRIPSFIGNWTHMNRLDMQGTSLQGSFPSTLSNLTNLLEFRLTDFKGDGTFPPLQNMNLQTLILRNCSISGPIPEYIGWMSQLQTLDLSFNYFSGEIPGSLREPIQQIKHMYLSNNMLNGTIPEWIFGNQEIDLSYNFFTGPDKGTCMQNTVNLVSSISSLEKNSLTWCLRKNLSCPTTESTNYQLFINCGGGSVTVDGNDYEEDTNLVGDIAFFLANSERWSYSSTGDFVGNLNAQAIVTNASALNITNPQLYMSARTVASSLKYYGLCLQKGNYTVKLHFAEIIFTAKNFSSTGRRFFDVFIQGQKVLGDFNIAEAAQGTGREIVKSFNASVDTTLEIHFRWSGKGTNAIPDRGVYGPLISAISVTPNFEPMIDRKVHVDVIVAIILTSCAMVFLIILIAWFLLHHKGKESEDIKLLKLQGAHFSLRQIKIATKNFDLANKIGEGGFGAVYKGVLPNGSVVAVKQLSSTSMQGNREFVNEVGIISSLNHPNLVKLFGCCIEGSELLLIYELMERNSLARALFGPEEIKVNLDWQTRRKISLHIARGLAYLHESKLKIVHRDIKATNVLLDKDLNAKIADFGLAKLYDEGKTHISTRIAGTVGYMAPEYATRGHLTEKADVYSFGVVLLEIISGNSNVNYESREEFMYLIDQACTLQEQGRLLELVDPTLGSDYSRVEAEQLLNLSLVCTSLSPALRPTMSSVVTIIEGRLPVPVSMVMSVYFANKKKEPFSLGKFFQDMQGTSFDGLSITSSATVSNGGDGIGEEPMTPPLIEEVDV